MARTDVWRRECAGALLVLAVAMALHSHAAEQQPFVTGTAYDLDSGDVLYREHHYCTEARLRCTVVYRDPDGGMIARKELDYREHPHRPVVRVEDRRREREQVIEPEGRDDLVVDAGFDNFIRSQWQPLAAGDEVEFSFQVIGFGDPLSMVARRDDAADCDAGQLCLEVALDSWLLGLFGDPIQLTYDSETRRLLRFRGISNLRSAQGKSQSVDIRYDYAAAASRLPSTAPQGRVRG